MTPEEIVINVLEAKIDEQAAEITRLKALAISEYTKRLKGTAARLGMSGEHIEAAIEHFISEHKLS